MLKPEPNEGSFEPATYRARLRHFIFHPIFVLLISIVAALLYACWVTWRFRGGHLSSHYVYVVPTIVPFVAFLFDRAERVNKTSSFPLATDALVVAVSVLRMLGQVPLISGHALFLGYAVLRPGSWVTRISAALLLAQTVYLKFFVWHDPVSPLVGITLATAAAIFTRRTEN